MSRSATCSDFSGGELPRPGRLYIVATPIGNLADITLRAIKVLSSVEVIAAEDTRTTRVLLKHHGIDTPLVSHHEHNSAASVAGLMSRLRDSADIALVSDAGTPSISDPGYTLVNEAAAAGIEVVCVPGPSAAVSALVISGLPTDRFTFEGFLPKSGGARAARIEACLNSECTVVIFESVHRIDATLTELAGIAPERPAALCREMTKLHEEVRRGTLAELARGLRANPAKGEIALVVGGKPEVTFELADALPLALEKIASGASTKAAVTEVASSTGVSSRELYQLVISIER